MIILLSVPFAAIGGVWLMYLLGYNTSVATWVGFIALSGLAAQTGVVMIIYLDQYYEKMVREGKTGLDDLYRAVHDGAVQRVRPKMMTVMAMTMGLLPLMWSHGAGADMMKRIAAPMVGGLVTSTVLTLVIIPAVYAIWRERGMRAAKDGD